MHVVCITQTKSIETSAAQDLVAVIFSQRGRAQNVREHNHTSLNRSRMHAQIQGVERNIIDIIMSIMHEQCHFTVTKQIPE